MPIWSMTPDDPYAPLSLATIWELELWILLDYWPAADMIYEVDTEIHLPLEHNLEKREITVETAQDCNVEWQVSKFSVT